MPLSWPLRIFSTERSLLAGSGHATPTTVPALRASTISPELRAACTSMPVPTIGDSDTSSGTACFCMFEPMSARFASSCSRNGIRDVATLTICFGDTSMKSTSVMGRSLKV